MASTVSTTTAEALHTANEVPCTESQIKLADCKRDGECYVVGNQNSDNFLLGCACPPGTTGDHCELEYLDVDFWKYFGNYAEPKNASISIEACAVLLACILTVVIAFYYMRQKRTKQDNIVQYIYPTNSATAEIPNENKDEAIVKEFTLMQPSAKHLAQYIVTIPTLEERNKLQGLEVDAKFPKDKLPLFSGSLDKNVETLQPKR